MNSKEALEKLYDGFQNGMAGRSFYDIIKTDLEKLEQLERNNQNDKEFIKLQNEVIKIKEDENNKLKKIIELWKNKKVSQFWILMSDSVDRYNAVMCEKRQILTQEEYDLLKEYLQNE